jgi:hypothetical protein
MFGLHKPIFLTIIPFLPDVGHGLGTIVFVILAYRGNQMIPPKILGICTTQNAGITYKNDKNEKAHTRFTDNVQRCYYREQNPNHQRSQ